VLTFQKFLTGMCQKTIFSLFFFSECSDRRVLEDYFLLFVDSSVFFTFFESSVFSDRRVPEDEFSYVIAIDVCARAAGRGGGRGGVGWRRRIRYLMKRWNGFDRYKPLRLTMR
jgi:hypothetical protein